MGERAVIHSLVYPSTHLLRVYAALELLQLALEQGVHLFVARGSRLGHGGVQQLVALNEAVFVGELSGACADLEGDELLVGGHWPAIPRRQVAERRRR